MILKKTCDELVEMFVKMAKTESMKNPAFYRYYNQHPAENQEAIWQEVEKRGYERPERFKISKEETPEAPKPRSKKVMWTEQEIKFLAITVWELREKFPADSFFQLIVKAQERFRPERRRPINGTAAAQPIIDCYQKIEAQVRADAKEAKVLQERLDSDPTKKLTDEEILDRYGEQVFQTVTPDEIVNEYASGQVENLLEAIPLAKLAGHTAERLVAHWETQQENAEFLNEILMDFLDSQNPKETPEVHTISANSNGQAKPRKPRVTVLGMKPGQTHVVRSALGDRADFNFVDKNRKSKLVNQSTDVCVLWARFSSHAMQEQVKKQLPEGASLIIIPRGGTERMIEELDKVLN